uniref:DNA-directed RNA polymerase n=1 Tax=Toxoplasma gondii COUG TaxID=1074873 RepID=A0A2G8XVN0_TOXGO|nr:DNA-directed RNA polymerase I RPA2 [Toxoplasma gondii COUG]
MVRSKLCSTRGMSPAELQRAGEDVDDGGGYFIINGNERVIRFVVQQRTNFPIALKRPAFANRDAFCTPYAVLLRSQRYDGTSTSNILLDTEDGRCTYRILLNRQEYFCGFFLLLRCLAGNLSLAQLKAKLLEGCWDDAADATARSQLVEELWGQEATFADSDVLENRVGASRKHTGDPRRLGGPQREALRPHRRGPGRELGRERGERRGGRQATERTTRGEKSWKATRGREGVWNARHGMGEAERANWRRRERKRM